MDEIGDRLLVEMQRRSTNDGTGSGGIVGGQGDSPGRPEILDPSQDGQTSSSPGSEDRVVTFSKDSSIGLEPKALAADESKRDVSWNTRNGSVTITQVFWYGHNGEPVPKGQLDIYDKIATAHPSENKTDPFNSSNPFLDVYTTNASLNVGILANEAQQSEYLSRLMYLSIHWETDIWLGITRSAMFTVVKTEEEARAWNEQRIAGLSDNQRISNETLTLKNGQLLTETKLPPSLKPSATSTESQAPTSAPEIAPTEQNGGNNGLSTGVIVGIAVGGAAALIILITAIFLLYRRRHRKRQAAEQAGYDSQQGATVFFADKETSRVPETPQTPYSEDGGQRLPLSDMPGVAITHDHVQQDQQQQQHLRNTSNGNSTFIPYKNPEPATSRTDLAVRSGTATPLGLSSNIAHLVEDGMTEDEIRRLEEEERQLDDAIAQARRR